ncbi:MAG: EAL domain-containing protein [Halothiobacillus sp.]|jgi:diguanylate cyclase (GGDEF)-like protein|nr:EAL domain-containing protein [Halothiobacillus sp.]
MPLSGTHAVIRSNNRSVMGYFWQVLLVMACVLPSVQAAQETDQVITVGVLAYDGKQRTLSRWQPTADYLSALNPADHFQIEPLFQSELAAAVREGRLDFVLTQPLQFIELSRQDNVWPLATMSMRSPNGKLERFGSVIIVRSDRADLQHLADLKGKVVAGVADNALGSWLLGLDALSRAGIDPHTQIHSLFTGLPMEHVLRAVLEDRADAGIVRTGYLDRLIAEGRLSSGQLRVLDPRNYPDFPYSTSTELVPEWPFLATTRVSNHFAREVARQLLAMPADSPAAQTAGIQTWALPLDYSTVQHIRDQWLPDTPSLVRVFQAYGFWLMLPISVLVFLFYLQGKRTQKFLRLQEKRLRSTLNALHDAVVVLSPAGRVQFANQSTQMLLQFPNHPLANLQGRHFSELFHMQWSDARDVGSLQQAIELLSEKPEQAYEIQFLIGHQLREIDLRVSWLGDDGVHVQSAPRIILSMRDVTDYREATALLAYRASHDRLTGLMNRAAFEEFLESQCHSQSERKSDGLVLWVDVDDFRLINESNSREVGDQIIARLASHLSLELPTSGLIARLGADEFGLWIPDIQSISFRQWPDDLLTSLRKWRFTVGVDRVRITLSIGVSMADYRLGADLLKDAEAACRRAYREGGNRVYWYTRDDQEIATRRLQLATLGQLKQALDEERFCQVIQRIQPTRANGVVASRAHYEVLLRVCNANGELQNPTQFIEAAEKYHFMAEIDRWVIRKAFGFLAQIKSNPPILSINLSGATVQDPQINPFIRAAFREFDLDPALICFEITETSAITNYELVLELMTALRELGCSLSLDDFGGGLLSFEFLRRLQPDYVKIDGKLIRDIVDDPVAVVIVSAIHQVALVMQAQTIGEWVENEAIQARLEEIGIHYVQGYLHHRPSPVSELLPDYSPACTKSPT